MEIETYKLGEMLDSFNYQQVQDELEAILEKGCSLVIDMTACSYVSSMGLRVLLYSKKVAASKGNNCYLVGVNDEVKDVMDVTGFNNFFEMYDTMEEFKEKVKN